MIRETAVQLLRTAFEARPEIAFAYLFGSGAAGRTHGRSDVDVAVCLTPEGERRDRASNGPESGWSLWTDLLAVAQDALGREDVDLVLIHRAPPLLADRIARHGRLVFSRDEPRRVRWLVYTKSRHCDLRPLRNLLDTSLERRIRSGSFGRGEPASHRG